MYTFDILETRNPDEWFAMIVATDETGRKWELLDTILWLPAAEDAADELRWELEYQRKADPQTPGEYWQEM